MADSALTLLEMPEEIISLCLSKLSAPQTAALRLVSRRICQVASADSLWWHFLKVDFGIDSEEPYAMATYAELARARFDPATAGSDVRVINNHRTAVGTGSHGVSDKVALNAALTLGVSRFAVDVLIEKSGWSFVGVGRAEGLRCSSVCCSGDVYSYGFDGHIYDACNAQFHRSSAQIEFKPGCVIGLAVDLTEAGGPGGTVYYYRNGENVGFSQMRPWQPTEPLLVMVEVRDGCRFTLRPPTSFVPPWRENATPLYVYRKKEQTTSL